MEVKDILIDYLKTHRFGGLFNDVVDCGCGISNFAPCGEIQLDCEAGYEVACDCGEHDCHIQRDKPEDLPPEPEEPDGSVSSDQLINDEPDKESQP